MTIKFIRHKLLKAGYYCDRNPRNRVVRVWSTSKGMQLPAHSDPPSLYHTACATPHPLSQTSDNFVT